MRLSDLRLPRLSWPAGWPEGRRRLASLFSVLLAAWLLLTLLLMFWWSFPPAPFDPKVRAEARRAAGATLDAPGSLTVLTAIALIDGLRDKPGGYLSNDLFPPGAWMDDMPNFEFGQLQQLRDFALALRNDFSRAQTQSEEDPDLREAQPMLAYPNDRWIFESTESQHRRAVEHLERYLARLNDPKAKPRAEFHVRADNLVDWLNLVEKQIGSLSQRLTAAVGRPREGGGIERTPWTRIDDNFYEARGAAYALLHLLRAVEVDFERVLRDKNAQPAFEQLRRELEATQAPLWSPVILNGSGFGLFANHSLVMANSIGRANSALTDLRSQLTRG